MINFLRYAGFLWPRRGFCTLLLVVFVLSAAIISSVTNYYNTHYGWGPEEETKSEKSEMNSFAIELMPHLIQRSSSLKPVFLLNGSRQDCELVIGITTTHSDKELYILVSLMNLIDAMNEKEKGKTLIIVLVAELILDQVRPLLELLAFVFAEHVHSGLVEIVVPSPHYYPDLETLTTNPLDPSNRVKRRTKQNLDILYLMAYARPRGTYYLSLRDDITVKYRFVEHIMDFIKTTSDTNPHWYVLEFCNVRGVGKVFRTKSMVQFMTYIQIFYKNMPIDWLLNSYIANSSCSRNKTTETCKKNKLKSKPKYPVSLFNHIGLYSTSEGKVQILKHLNTDEETLFTAHDNPPVDRVYTDIPAYDKHTLLRAYEGETFFWGKKPVEGNVVEFWFREPTIIVSYAFGTGNILHEKDKFYHAVVEVLPYKRHQFIYDKDFGEFGYVYGDLHFGELVAIRIRVTKNSTHMIVLSEIQLVTIAQAKSRQRKIVINY
nr:alpha-1,3-mannosyl-glycoprotein 4-beta-N-acetylglucosaminyltransferase A-like isoform X2 [Danaus plexippus plexippus]